MVTSTHRLVVMGVVSAAVSIITREPSYGMLAFIAFIASFFIIDVVSGVYSTRRTAPADPVKEAASRMKETTDVSEDECTVCKQTKRAIELGEEEKERVELSYYQGFMVGAAVALGCKPTLCSFHDDQLRVAGLKIVDVMKR